MTNSQVKRLITIVTQNAARNVRAPTKAQRMKLLVKSKIYTADGKLSKHYR